MKHEFFENSFFLLILQEWNNLDRNINLRELIFSRTIISYSLFDPFCSIFDNNNKKGIKLMTRLLLGLSHVCEHKFKHSFQDCLNAISSCVYEIETTTQHLFNCSIYKNERMILLDKVRNIKTSI